MRPTEGPDRRSDPVQQRPDGARLGTGDDFPTFTASSDDLWYRAHTLRPGDTDGGCWWFASREADETYPSGRFDLRAPRGTCYPAATPGVAARENVGRFLAYDIPIPLTHLEGRVVTRLRLPEPRARLADVADERAAGLGVTAELATGNDYAVSSAWADAFDALGFDGIRYTPRFTPGGSSTAVACFGEAAAHPEYPVLDRQPLLDVVVNEGYRIARSTVPDSRHIPSDGDDSEPEIGE